MLVVNLCSLRRILYLLKSFTSVGQVNNPPPSSQPPLAPAGVCVCVSGHLLLPLRGWHSSGEVIKALTNRSTDVSTRTPQDTKRKQPENWAGIVSVCLWYKGTLIFQHSHRCFVQWNYCCCGVRHTWSGILCVFVCSIKLQHTFFFFF